MQETFKYCGTVLAPQSSAIKNILHDTMFLSIPVFATYLWEIILEINLVQI